MSSTTVMKAKARLIKEETQEGANTAARVGGLFEDIVDYLDSADISSSLKIDRYVTTGTRIAKFTVGGEETIIYAPSNSGSGGGGGGSSYDDTEIREILNELDRALDNTTALANSEKERLNGVIADIDANVKQKMADAIEFAEWVQGNFPQGATGYQSGWDEKTKQFLQVVGMWDTETDSPAVTTTKWSKITQDVDDIYAEVTSITTGGEVTAEMVQSWIGTSVQNKIAELNLGTTYATQDDTGEILKWLYSALKGSSSEYTTYNQFVSAARNGASTAISELRTYVEQLKDGSFIANANIVSKVDDAIAELYTSASSNNAKTYIFSTIDKNSQDIATIVTAATGISTSADIATKFATWKAGLATKSYVDGATAGLVAANDYNAAAVVAMINGAGSSVKISADHVSLVGITTVYDPNGEPIIECDSNGIHMGYGVSSGTGHSRLNISEGIITSDVRSSSHTWESYELGYDGFEISSGNNSDAGHNFTTLITSQSIDISEAGGTGAVNDAYHTAITDKGIRIYHPISGSSVVDLFTVTVASDSSRETDLYIKNDITADGEITASSFNMGNYNFDIITIGNSTYLRISTSGTTGVYMNASGRLGVVINNSFKPSLDFDDYYSRHSTRTPGLGEFLTNTGSDLNNYYIRNGLIVEG